MLNSQVQSTSPTIDIILTTLNGQRQAEVILLCYVSNGDNTLINFSEKCILCLPVDIHFGRSISQVSRASVACSLRSSCIKLITTLYRRRQVNILASTAVVLFRDVAVVLGSYIVQVLAVDDKLARRAASRQTCCKQRWTLSAINLRPN